LAPAAHFIDSSSAFKFEHVDSSGAFLNFNLSTPAGHYMYSGGAFKFKHVDSGRTFKFEHVDSGGVFSNFNMSTPAGMLCTPAGHLNLNMLTPAVYF